MTYASKTSVPVARTRAEIEELLTRHGASRIGIILEPDRASVGFTVEGWSVRFALRLPSMEEAKNKASTRGQRRDWMGPTEDSKKRWLDQTSRERWRALLLTVKAKLVSVESGVETFEQAFMAHLVLPGGETVGEQSLPQLRNHVRQLPAGAPQ